MEFLELLIEELKFLSQNMETVSIGFIQERIDYLYNLAFENYTKEKEKK